MVAALGRYGRQSYDVIREMPKGARMKLTKALKKLMDSENKDKEAAPFSGDFEDLE